MKPWDKNQSKIDLMQYMMLFYNFHLKKNQTEVKNKGCMFTIQPL
jgi:hypothetical protein